MTPVLLVHSSGFTSRQWRKLGELLAPRHRVIAPDLGHMGPITHAAQVNAVIAAFIASHDRA